MPKFYFSATDEDGTVTNKEFDTDYLGDVVDKTGDFLAGVGYCFGELVATPVVESLTKVSPTKSEYKSVYLSDEDSKIDEYYKEYLNNPSDV